MDLETQPTDKENKMHSNEEEMNTKLEAQQSRETSSKPINQNINDSKNENTQSSETNNFYHYNQKTKKIILTKKTI